MEPNIAFDLFSIIGAPALVGAPFVWSQQYIHQKDDFYRLVINKTHTDFFYF